MDTGSPRRPFWFLFRSAADVRSDVDEELEHHLSLRVEELVARGVPVEEARREVLRRFGDLAATRAYCRREDQDKEGRMRRGLMVDELLQDLRTSLRSLGRVPMMTAAIVVT